MRNLRLFNLFFFSAILVSKLNSQTNFISYGTSAGDIILTPDDDSAFIVQLGFDFYYFSQFYSNLTISINGFLSLSSIELENGSLPIKVNNHSNTIAAYNSDLMTKRCGSIYIRLISDVSTLNIIGNEISNLLYNSSNSTLTFKPTNAFVATWYQVCSFHNSINGTVSFQLIISTDGKQTFLTLNYDILEFPAEFGSFFQYLDPNHNLKKTQIAPSGPQNSSNVNVNGKWIYHLSDGN